jgi:hypothetical protein
LANKGDDDLSGIIYRMLRLSRNASQMIHLEYLPVAGQTVYGQRNASDHTNNGMSIALGKILVNLLPLSCTDNPFRTGVHSYLYPRHRKGFMLSDAKSNDE